MGTALDYIHEAMLEGLPSSVWIPYFYKWAGLDFLTSPSNMRSIMVLGEVRRRGK